MQGKNGVSRGCEISEFPREFRVGSFSRVCGIRMTAKGAVRRRKIKKGQESKGKTLCFRIRLGKEIKNPIRRLTDGVFYLDSRRRFAGRRTSASLRFDLCPSGDRLRLEGTASAYFGECSCTSVKIEKGQDFSRPFSIFNPGDDLLSHAVTHAVPSALEGLTSVFGMGTGVAPPV